MVCTLEVYHHYWRGHKGHNVNWPDNGIFSISAIRANQGHHSSVMSLGQRGLWSNRSSFCGKDQTKGSLPFHQWASYVQHHWYLYSLKKISYSIEINLNFKTIVVTFLMSNKSASASFVNRDLSTFTKNSVWKNMLVTNILAIFEDNNIYDFLMSGLSLILQQSRLNFRMCEEGVWASSAIYR